MAGPSSASPEAGWAEARRLIEPKKRSLATVLAGTLSVALEGESLIVTLEDGSQFVRGTVEDRECRALVAEAVAAAFRRPVRVEFRFAERAHTEAPAQAAVRPDEGPAVGPEAAGRRDEPAVIRAALDLFGGRVVSNGGL